MWPFKNAPPAQPAPVPGGGAVGINLPPDSLPAQLRVVARMIRLLDAMAKAARKGDKARVDALDDELAAKRQRLLGIGVRAPYKRDDLVALHDEILARVQGGRG